MAATSSSQPRKVRNRRCTTSSRAPRPFVTTKKSARARRPTRSATAGSRPCRCATVKTPCSSARSASRSSMQRAASNIPWHGSQAFPVTKQNVAETVACGRTRWKIENEGFNVMKNHGYEFEHNSGHGARFLAMTLARLNILAFAWHTALELLEPPWTAAREAAAKRTSFFAHLATITAYAIFPSWLVFLKALMTFTIPPELLKTQKIE